LEPGHGGAAVDQGEVIRARDLWRRWSFRRRGVPVMEPRFPVLMADGTLCLLLRNKPRRPWRLGRRTHRGLHLQPRHGAHERPVVRTPPSLPWPCGHRHLAFRFLWEAVASSRPRNRELRGIFFTQK
jgi:hypothetical protein